MKRIITLVAAICLCLGISTLAQQPVDFTGKMIAAGYLSYSIGMGDPFKDVKAGYTTFESSAGIGLGGHFFYGMNENVMLGGELMLQNYGFKQETESYTMGLITVPASSSSNSEMKFNIIANGLYAINAMDTKSLYAIGGLGLYDFGGMKLGLNAGIVYSVEVSPKVSIFGMPRFHIVFADDTFELLQLAVGAQFSVGPGQ